MKNKAGVKGKVEIRKYTHGELVHLEKINNTIHLDKLNQLATHLSGQGDNTLARRDWDDYSSGSGDRQSDRIYMGHKQTPQLLSNVLTEATYTTVTTANPSPTGIVCRYLGGPPFDDRKGYICMNMTSLAVDGTNSNEIKAIGSLSGVYLGGGHTCIIDSAQLGNIYSYDPDGNSHGGASVLSGYGTVLWEGGDSSDGSGTGDSGGIGCEWANGSFSSVTLETADTLTITWRIIFGTER